jgi:glyoxylase-like metal-dependent hydrolase (beta-lactamase superfamily II)/rhodanese-related sulfurtransferase
MIVFKSLIWEIMVLRNYQIPETQFMLKEEQHMRFEQLNPHSCKTYVIGDDDSKEIIMVDPVLDHFKDYLDYLEKHGLELLRVVDTHTHADHISGCAALSDITGCDYLMHDLAPAGCVTERVHEGQEFNIGTIRIKVIDTPGHTKDSLSLILTDRIFTGDALFLDDGGAGRDDLPGGDPSQHWETLEKFKALSEDLVVYPAHDYRNRNPSNLGNQKKTNPHLKNRSKEEYVEYIEDLRLGPAEWMKDVLSANYACARDPKAAWVPVDAPACEIKGTLEHGVNDIVAEEISPQTLNDMLESEKAPVLLDVRLSLELKGKLGHLDGIVHIPIRKLTSGLQKLDQYKDSHIVTVCRSGKRAYTAAQILKQAGFEHVSVLSGGMMAWRKSFGEKNR